MKEQNPFEEYGIDPREGVSAITERFRELLENAETDDERQRLRAAWEELTFHPARRLRAAFGAHPVSAPMASEPAPNQEHAPLFEGEISSFVFPFRHDPILFPSRK